MRYRLSSRIDRIKAYILDNTFTLVVFFAIIHLTDYGISFELIGQFLFLIYLIWYFFYNVLTQDSTWGKKYMSLFIKSYDGSKISLRQLIIRQGINNLFYLLLSLGNIIYLIQAFNEPLVDTPIYGIMIEFSKMNSLAVIKVILQIFLAINIAIMLFDPKRRSLTDYIAGTIVVEG